MNSPTGHTGRRIFTLNGSDYADSRCARAFRGFRWHCSPFWGRSPPKTAEKLKFRIFENSRLRPPFWNITKIAISPQRFGRSLRGLVQWCKRCLLSFFYIYFDIMSTILLSPPESWCAKFDWNRFNRYGSAHAWKKTFLCGFFINISRVCAVAQYVVLEANAEVNGRGPFSHPTPPKPLNQFRCHVKYITTSPGVDVQNSVWIDSAVKDLRIREKHVLCGFF